MEAKIQKLKPEMLFSILVANFPQDITYFNSETGYGEPQHFMELPKGRALEVVYEDAGCEEKYFSARVHCNEKEFENNDYHSTMGVIDTMLFDTLETENIKKVLLWAITNALI